MLRDQDALRPDSKRRLEEAGYRISTLRDRRPRKAPSGGEHARAIVVDLGLLGQEGFLLVSRSGRPGPALAAALATSSGRGRGRTVPVVLDERLLAIADLPEEGIPLDVVERILLRKALERTGGNQTHAACLLGLSRQTLIYRMRKHGLRREEGA